MSKEDAVQGRLAQSGWILMGILPALIAGMVLVLTRTGEAARVGWSNQARGIKGTLVVSVGNSNFGGGPLSAPAGPIPIPPQGPGPLPKGNPSLQWAQSLASAGRDTLYIAYSRRPEAAAANLMGRSFEGERITVGAYRTTIGSANRNGDTKLGAVREIAFDTRLVGLDEDTTKQVKQIQAAFDKAVKPGAAPK